MNLIGKIFVCLITLLSLVFLATTVVLYASHNKWKEKAEAVKKNIEPLEVQKKDLTEKKEALIQTIEEEKLAYQKSIAALKTKSDELHAENARLSSKNNDLDSDLRKRTEVIAQNNAIINTLQKNIEKLSTDLATTQESRAEYLGNLASAVGELHEQATMIGDIEKRNRDLQEDFNKAKTVLDMNNLKPTPELYDRTPAFNVKAKVVAIKEGPKKLVMIDAGSDEGLKSLHTLEVYRGATYLGRIEVVTTEPHKAVCQVLPQYQQGEIMEGDRVASKLEKE